MSDQKILLATSIAPHNIENQMHSVQSWMDCGFEIISCNAKDEIEQLGKLFTDMRFIEVKRDARCEKGRPLVYVYDILQELKWFDRKVCGIVNSDIHLRNISKDMYDLLIRETKDSLVFGHRYDVDSLSEKLGDKYIGVDLVLFDKALIDIYQDDKLVMGAAAWDYWMVFIAKHYGKEVKELLDPVAFHIRHPQAWSDMEDLESKRRLAEKYCENSSAQTIITQIDGSVLKCKTKLAYCEHSSHKKVLIVINGKIRDETMDSILRQNYGNFEIAPDYLDRKYRAEVDYVLIPYDGIVYNEHFLSYMLTSAADAESVTTSLAVFSESSLFFNVTSRHLKRLRGEVYYGCSLIKPEFLLSTDYRKLSAFHYVEFSDKDLVQITYRDYVDAVITSDNRKRYFLWGAGSNTRYVLDRIDSSQQTIIGIVDSDPLLSGQLIDGIPVVNVEALADEQKYDAVLITPLRWEKEIYSQLEKMIPEEKILCFGYSINDVPTTMIERYLSNDIILVGSGDTYRALKSGCLRNNYIIDEINESEVSDDVISGFLSAIIHRRPNIVIIPDNSTELKAKMESEGMVYMDHFVTHSDFKRVLNSTGENV